MTNKQKEFFKGVVRYYKGILSQGQHVIVGFGGVGKGVRLSKRLAILNDKELETIANTTKLTLDVIHGSR